MRDDRRADLRPIVEPMGIVDRQIHTAVAHRMTKVVVPVGPVDRIVAGKIHHSGAVGQTVRLCPHPAAHRLRLYFQVDLVMTHWRWMPRDAGRNQY